MSGSIRGLPLKENKFLIIAGFDPSGNAGIVRDLQVAHNLGLNPAVVITALTIQDHKHFYSSGIQTRGKFFAQLYAVSPLKQYGAIKIGMLGNEQIVMELVRFLKKEKKVPPIVLDPVLHSTTGGILLTQKGCRSLINELVPRASLWTPNLSEASFFSGIRITTRMDFENAGQVLWKKYRVPVLLKGFMKGKRIIDLLVNEKGKTWLDYPKIKTKKNLRGTGCALSTLIACHLAKGQTLSTAVKKARMKMQNRIKRNFCF